MAASKKSWKDYVWLAWFIIQVPIITCIDLADKLPTWVLANPSSPLHAAHVFREKYIRDYNDPLLQDWYTADKGWIQFFGHTEVLFILPTVFYAAYRLSGRAGTTGPLELLLLLYSAEMAYTTATVMAEVKFWPSDVFSPEQKNMFFYQILAPYCAIVSLMFVDMYARILARFRVADSVKKNQ